MGLNAGTARLVGRALVQSIKDSFADNATQWAAAIAYYTFLSLFPLLLAVVSLSAYFVSPDWAVGKAILLLRELVPAGDDAVQRIIHDAVHAAHPYAGAVSLLILLVLGSRAFGALSRALNIAYEGVETGSMAARIMIEVGMMAAVGVLFISTLFSHYLLLFLWNAVRLLPGETGPTFDAIVQLIRVLLLLMAFFLIYRFVPRKQLNWKSIAVGAGVATALFLAARPLFYGYVENLANYNLMYGGIAIAVVLLAWAWVTAFITILGGEMASHFQAMVLDGAAAKTVDRKRMHRKSLEELDK
jgi:membrane protein